MAIHPKGLTLSTMKEVQERLKATGQTQVVTNVETMQYLFDIIAEKDEEIKAWRKKAGTESHLNSVLRKRF